MFEVQLNLDELCCCLCIFFVCTVQPNQKLYFNASHPMASNIVIIKRVGMFNERSQMQEYTVYQ